MTQYLYIDGSCGISGDMAVASLLDLGASRDKLDRAIESLHLEGFHYRIERKASYSISGLYFAVHLHRESEPHEERYHARPHGHCHEHRHLADVEAIIEKTEMADTAKALAKKIFRIVAQAEAKAHGVPIEEVHFHEVGAIDSIVDIIGAAVLLDDLAVKNVVLTALCEGTGTVQCQHGALPVPVPAVLNIAEAHQIPLRQTSARGEMVTPTGIAIAAALSPKGELPKAYRIIKSGIGLGKRDFGRANFLRTMIIEDAEAGDAVYVAECNIDDGTGELLGYAMEKIFEAGALDVHYEPCFMKKNRPAYLLRAILPAQKKAAVEYAILKHTTTIGVRFYPVERTCMQRTARKVKLAFGEVDVKISTYKDIVRIQPEFESVKKLAEKTGKDFQFVYNAAQRAAMEEAHG